MIIEWIREKLERCGFSGNLIDEDDVEFAPLSSMIGDYIRRDEFVQMRDGVVAIEFVEEGVVELYRVGLKEVYVDGGEAVCMHGLWPINGTKNTRASSVFHADTYGRKWRAFHISFPINAKDIGVIVYQ